MGIQVAKQSDKSASKGTKAMPRDSDEKSLGMAAGTVAGGRWEGRREAPRRQCVSLASGHHLSP